MTTYSRGKFLKTAAIGTAGLTIVPNTVLGKARGYTSPSDKLNIAGIGVGGMGRRNLANMKTENIVALCDVDWKYAAKTFNDYPKARQFKEWRLMFDRMGKSIDAIMAVFGYQFNADQQKRLREEAGARDIKIIPSGVESIDYFNQVAKEIL